MRFIMEASRNKDKTRALAGTVVFHAMILIVFLLFGLTSPELPQERGVLVALGYTEEGIGDRQPLTASPPDPAPTPASPETEPDPVVTQDTEESVAIPDATEETHTEATDTDTDRPGITPEPEEVVEEEPEEEPEPEPDPRAMFPGQDQRSTDQQQQGETEEDGDAGSLEGLIDADDLEDEEGGEGIEYSLTGREANLLPKPDYTTPATGRVVVRIVVNRDGQVLRATAGARGTTTTDTTLHRVAEEAAKNARFNRTPSAPEEQTGTITYIFIRRN